MAEESPAAGPPPDEKTEKRKKQAKRSRGRERGGKERGPKSLAWRKSLPDEDEDPFALVTGGEGGFLSLEEIDESEYGLIGGILNRPRRTRFLLLTRRSGSLGAAVAVRVKRSLASRRTGNRRRWPRRSRGRRRRKRRLARKITRAKRLVSSEFRKITDMEDDSKGEFVFKNDEYRAWKKMKLHPLLMRSIRRLGFKEPTPIQKACIPVAATKERLDVIGAAETGSGKTLAFGLPILQRLLKERDKAARLSGEDQDGSKAGIHGGPLRALILAPTRELSLQVCDHLKEAANLTSIRIVPIVGGMSTEKQQRLLKNKPDIIVGTPGRLWELMSGGEQHLVELNSLSFFVLDEADRMIENGHFNELQSIIDMLPSSSGSVEPGDTSLGKKRQTFVFSATISLSNNFHKKLKRGFLKAKSGSSDDLSSIEKLSERAGMRPDVEVVDLTNASIVANKLEESFIDIFILYFKCSWHGRTIVFCTSIAALRRISSLLRILGIRMWTLHAQMQQRARLKAIDRFRESDDGVLVATDVAARGLDIPGVRTVIHFQLPHSADVYIHRSGRTARASADGCCIALISPADKTKFFSLCKSLSKVMKRLSLARQIDKMMRINSRENASKSWFERSAEAVELMADDSGSEEETVQSNRKRKVNSAHLQKLQQELNSHLAKPLQPRTLSHRFLAGYAGLSPLLQQQLVEFSKKRGEADGSKGKSRAKLVVIGQDRVEPLAALRSSGQQICVDTGKWKATRRLAEDSRRNRREEKKREREQRRKNKRKMEKNK
ncbi:unnamed protein product [Spirodela intermedia]|uniref:Uncharacterized protein n=1 Tax=Spirodela intermedia TaxID=51605 RepID=A0A7I8JAM8_SPIIN|nr:unnamed protein product [Spirodela intermedia]CAA6666482.1 unnamed protein product [Spirodela intermedia]